MNLPRLPELIRCFLYDQLHPDGPLTSTDVPLTSCPHFDGRTYVFNVAVATFYTPSDVSGTGGMHREWIRMMPVWRKGPPRYDCVFIERDPDFDGMRGLDVVRIQHFFSFKFHDTVYPCALVRWYERSDGADDDTGMWGVQPEVDTDGLPVMSVIHLDCIVHAAHLVPIYGDEFVLKELMFHQSLDAFAAFYVNKFTDYHACEIAY